MSTRGWTTGQQCYGYCEWCDNNFCDWLISDALMVFFPPAPDVSVDITTSGPPTLGQSGYSLTCGVTGAENLSPSITYQWTKNNGTHTQLRVGTDRVLSFSPLRLSDAGRYTCQANVSSPYLNNDIIITDTQDITIHGEFNYKTHAYIEREGLQRMTLSTNYIATLEACIYTKVSWQ